MAATNTMADPAAPKPASDHTKKANARYLDLPFKAKPDEITDFTLAWQGHIASLPEPVQIPSYASGTDSLVWNSQIYDFIPTPPKGSNNDPNIDAPDTVNPSLWRMARLNKVHGLFEVVKGEIYQVRGYDLSVMTIIRTNVGNEPGYIVVDPLVSEECAEYVWKNLVIPNLGENVVFAIIYTHSHVDHYGGALGLGKGMGLERSGHKVHDVAVRIAAGITKIYAPANFTEAAVGENVIAGNAMSRRGAFMYGNLIGKGVTGQVDAGLGKTTSGGQVGFHVPTEGCFATTTGEIIKIGDVEIVVLMAPESEAPAEFMFYLPRYGAFCAAEDATHTLHNLYTLRGAKVRDGLLWSKYLQQALDMFTGPAAVETYGKEIEVVFASHHWPTWGTEPSIALLKMQRDTYRFLHDQTMNLANKGYTPREIGEAIRLPKSLANNWASRSYHGTVYHDAVAQYNLRLGFFDGVPANLHRHPPAESAKRYVAFMGGAARVLEQARVSYNEGDYRWVAEVVNQAVFADPTNLDAKYLLADAYEQLGYQAESGPWRNFYLTGARELRHGTADMGNGGTASADTIRAMPLEMFFDYLGVRLDALKAGDTHVEFNIELTDTAEKYVLGVENAAIHYHKGTLGHADATVTMTRATLNEVISGEAELQDKVTDGDIAISGDSGKLGAFLSWLDTFQLSFNIVTP